MKSVLPESSLIGNLSFLGPPGRQLFLAGALAAAFALNSQRRIPQESLPKAGGENASGRDWL